MAAAQVCSQQHLRRYHLATKNCAKCGSLKCDKSGRDTAACNINTSPLRPEATTKHDAFLVRQRLPDPWLSTFHTHPATWKLAGGVARVEGRKHDLIGAPHTVTRGLRGRLVRPPAVRGGCVVEHRILLIRPQLLRELPEVPRRGPVVSGVDANSHHVWVRAGVVELWSIQIQSRVDFNERKVGSRAEPRSESSEIHNATGHADLEHSARWQLP